ncbi:MAG: TrpB-like pyridoxal phosphate-dependent enzyme [Saprospiraceae bacterium]|nr:TrpB-like pyridoxal phosphate-dependent enzyme [Saprospiraceae bacterium]HMT78218.1 TrpB-like pyridoxal phosphate-dependent enzyme [Saprospiraceae bacterium]HQU95920.1 TrpB-like pyridoxal phosphate-dependent enzyme [Saprospiraceae bacterium]
MMNNNNLLKKVKSDQIKITLSEEEIPTHWYNVLADMPHQPKPTLQPENNQPVTMEYYTGLYPGGCIEQEFSTERWIEIPEEVREIYKLWRPTPMVRAERFEKALGTDCKIYFKNEGVSPSGSHKTNSAIPQIYFAARDGMKKVVTETGAGQWGSAVAFAAQMYGLDCEVFMVRGPYNQKPSRRRMMNLWGAHVTPSPSEITEVGRKQLAENPDSKGSLGTAISESIEYASGNEDIQYVIGSVQNFVLLHQTVIGQECIKQFEKIGSYPDVVIAPLGGGANFGGIAFPFVQQVIKDGKKIKFVASEPLTCPKLSEGEFRYDYGDVGKKTPLFAMYTLGHDFMPVPNHLVGLRYHGAGPIISQLVLDGYIDSISHDQKECLSAGILFAKTEGLIPAPESTHAIASVIEEVRLAKEEGISKTILFNLCGHGLLDLFAYEDYLMGKVK